MSSFGRHLFSVCLGLGLVTTGCAGEQESLIVLHAPAWESEECFLDAGNDTRMSRGALQLGCPGLGTGYVLPLILLNQLVPQDTTNSGIETNEVQLLEADVTLSSDDAPEMIDAMRETDEAFVDFTQPLATDSVAPGARVGVFIDAIHPQAGQVLAEELNGTEVTIQAKVVVRGERTGNATSGGVGVIKSRSYSFPIKVGTGCTFTCEACEDEVCPADITAFHGGACGNAQDRPIVPASCPLPD